MKSSRKTTLTLTGRGLVDAEQDRAIDLCVYDTLLPCRQFAISHKVTEVGRVSITTEFLLRLLKSVDGMKEEDVASFLGFDRREMQFIYNEAETNEFVQRNEGRVYLTSVGNGLFLPGSDKPEIFEVESRQDVVGFDLLSLAPEIRRYLDPFSLSLPELNPVDTLKVSSAAEQIPNSFRRFYSEISRQRDVNAPLKRSLYSIDKVTPQDRFSSPVRIIAKSTGLRPSEAEPNLEEWRSDFEREDRPDVIEAASSFLAQIEESRLPDDFQAYELLIEMAPDFLSDFTRSDGLATERFYRAAYSRAGEARADRPTIPILGSFFTRENTDRLFDVLNYGVKKSEVSPSVFLWFTPQVAHWGATTVLPYILDKIRRISGSRANNETENEASYGKAIGGVTGRAPRHISKAFDEVITSDAPQLPRSMELLVVPGVMTAATISLPIGQKSGFPVPLGLASFDPSVILHAQKLALRVLPRFSKKANIAAQIEREFEPEFL